MSVVPYADQAEAVRREIKLRESVYPRRVDAQKMTQALADRELGRMRAVARTLELVVALERDLLERLDRVARDQDVGTLEESIWATLEQLAEEGRPEGGEQRSLL